MRQFYGRLEKCVLSAGKTMSINFSFFLGGVFGVFGGGSADFIFMGARIFLKLFPDRPYHAIKSVKIQTRIPGNMFPDPL